MPASITADFSKYPTSIRHLMPYVIGEVCELRSGWEVYSRLFMEDEARTQRMGNRLGGLLGVFQSLLQDDIFLSIARLTDRDTRSQSNLSLHALLAGVPDAAGADFADRVRASIDEICTAATTVRKHRNKRIAHFDVSVGVSAQALPVVTFRELKELIEKFESYLNLFLWEFERTTMFFDALSAYDITGPAEVAVLKADTYDALEAEGSIALKEWRRRSKE